MIEERSSPFNAKTIRKGLETMREKLSSIAIVATFCVLLLAGCSNNNDSTNDGKNTESKTTEKSSVSTNNSSTPTSDSSSSLSTASSEGKAPYAVDIAQFSSPATFKIDGVNVPPSITLENNDGTTVTFNDRNSNSVDQFAAQVDTIPTKEIRVFSHDGHAIRTVKVNTQITLTDHLSGNGGQDRNNVMYLITNKNGGFSLITPNYAGNVEESQRDVMLEAVQ